MKKAVTILLLGIILLGSISFVSAVQGVCTGTQTCFCSGKAVACPCDADPCKICGPTSPECTGQQGQPAPSPGTSEISGTGVFNTQNPQTFGDYVATLANGLRVIGSDAWTGLQNIGRRIAGQPLLEAAPATPTLTLAEVITTLVAATAILGLLSAIVKAILKKIFARKGMTRARPSYLRPTRPKREKVKWPELSWKKREPKKHF